jgi:hypothetical protein
MNLVKIPVINATVPSQYSNLNMQTNYPGEEWYRAFDGDFTTLWDAMANPGKNYILFTFDNLYLLRSLQLSVIGDGIHDPKTINLYSDANATHFVQSFSFPHVHNITTFAPILFNYTSNPTVTKQILLDITRWSTYQTFITELTLIGILN